MTAEARSSRHVALVLILLPIVMSCATIPREYEVDFGRVGLIWEGTQPRQVLIERTLVVPRDIGGDTALGFEIHPPGNEPYEVYSVHHLPSDSTATPSSAGFEPAANGGIKTPTERVVGPRVFSFGFDETDPIGVYLIEVFANDQLVGNASIRVVDPESTPASP